MIVFQNLMQLFRIKRTHSEQKSMLACTMIIGYKQ